MKFKTRYNNLNFLKLLWEKELKTIKNNLVEENFNKRIICFSFNNYNNLQILKEGS